MIEEVVYLLIVAFGIYVGYRCGVDDTKAKYEGKSISEKQEDNNWK